MDCTDKIKAKARKVLVCGHPGCGKSFARPSKLGAHELTHTGDRPHVCDVEGCAKAYFRSQHLKRHVQQAHTGAKSQAEKQFFCSFQGCNLSFVLKQSLKKHMARNHGDEKQYKCSEDGCSEVFRKKHQLKCHLFEHKGLLPFQCDVEKCLKKFAQLSHLQRHKKQHLGHYCQEEGCSAHFEKWSLMRKHVANAHKKTHKCRQCEKRYPSKYFLREHEESHGEVSEMLQCPIDGCPRRYAVMRNLTAHVKAYHGNKTFRCGDDACARTFATKQKLEQHLKVHDPTAPIKKKARKKTKSAASHLLKAVCGNLMEGDKQRASTTWSSVEDRASTTMQSMEDRVSTTKSSMEECSGTTMPSMEDRASTAMEDGESTTIPSVENRASATIASKEYETRTITPSMENRGMHCDGKEHSGQQLNGNNSTVVSPSIAAELESIELSFKGDTGVNIHVPRNVNGLNSEPLKNMTTENSESKLNASDLENHTNADDWTRPGQINGNSPHDCVDSMEDGVGTSLGITSSETLLKTENSIFRLTKESASRLNL